MKATNYGVVAVLISALLIACETTLATTAPSVCTNFSRPGVLNQSTIPYRAASASSHRYSYAAIRHLFS